MTLNAKYQARYRKRMEAEGFKQVSGMVHKDHAPAVRVLMRHLQENPSLRLEDIQIRDEQGRFVRVQL